MVPSLRRWPQCLILGAELGITGGTCGTDSTQQKCHGRSVLVRVSPPRDN